MLDCCQGDVFDYALIVALVHNDNFVDLMCRLHPFEGQGRVKLDWN